MEKKVKLRKEIARQMIIEYKEKYPNLQRIEIQYSGENNENLFVDDIKIVSVKKDEKFHGVIIDSGLVDKFDPFFYDIVRYFLKSDQIGDDTVEGAIIIDFETTSVYANKYETITTKRLTKAKQIMGSISKTYE